jgi:protein gp37
MDHQWARNLAKKAAEMGTAFFFKQSAAPRTEMGIKLDGRIQRKYPKPRKTQMLTTPIADASGRIPLFNLS